MPSSAPVEGSDDLVAGSDRDLVHVSRCFPRPGARRHQPPTGIADRERQWGREHLAAHRHPLFDAIPSVGDLASVRFPSRRRANTLQPRGAGLLWIAPFEACMAPPIAASTTSSDLDNSRFALPLGQSGNMLSPYARSYVDRWQRLT